MATYLNLGRYGDVCSFLPVLQNEYNETGTKPSLIISKDYADILDGVSYVEPIVYDGPFEDIAGALDYAKTLGHTVTTTQVVGITDVVVSQVYGNHHGPAIICDSFQQDAWRLANKLDLWPRQLPLVFDRRDKKREKRLYRGIPKTKPWIVVSSGGNSSPFPYNDLLWEILKNCLPEFHIIDLAEIKAEKFYDILGIMDHPNTAHLILTDSGPIHLAYATTKPVHAIVTDRPSLWHGTAWRPFYASYTRYRNFPRDVTRILDLIRTPRPKPTLPNIVHVYQRMPWATGDEKRRIPMIKDMLRLACLGRDDTDVLVMTNTDTCVASNFIQRLEGTLPAYAYRHDFKRLDEPLSYDRISAGAKYAGCDLFAMRVGWWRRNHHLFPDMVLGRETWDKILRELMKLSGGRELENCIFHEIHPSFWENPHNLNRDPSNLRNRLLARNWLIERNMPLQELEFTNYEGKFKKPSFK